MNVHSRGSNGANSPLVILLHGRGSNAESIIALADALPSGADYVAIDGPIFENGGYAWFRNRGIGRPIAESIAHEMDQFTKWLDQYAGKERPVYLIGFSGGGAFAGGLILSNRNRYAGAAILYATLPWDAEIPAEEGQLKDFPIFIAHGENDFVIPKDLLDRTWTYLTEYSAADVVTHKGSEGHQLTEESLSLLQNWLNREIKKA